MININDIISHWRINKAIPRFIILDKFTSIEIDKFICTLLNTISFDLYRSDGKIDDIRKIISMSNTTPKPTIYHIHLESSISIQAQNSLLKIAEEPPKNVYIILSTYENANIEFLPTLISRAIVVTSSSYYNSSKTVIDLVDSIITTIKNKSGVEMYKLCNNLKGKESEEGKIDCVEFYKEFKKHLCELPIDFYDIVFDIQESDDILRNINVNKKMIIEHLLNTILSKVKAND